MGPLKAPAASTPPLRQLTRLRERLGPLPIVNWFLERLGIDEILARHVPPGLDPRTKIQPSKALGVLLRSILVEREPVYRQQEAVETFCPSAFGLSAVEVQALSDDAVGRALDRLFTAGGNALVTACVVNARRGFGLALRELHNDSTSVRFCGQYRRAKGRSVRGHKAPWITYGYSKDHRPDLKQLLMTLTASADGMVPVHLRTDDGNTNDSTTHIETWQALCELHGTPSFLYVADSKLCSQGAMEEIDKRGGKFVTVLPRSRREDQHFREWIQEKEPAWEKVWDRPNPRRKYGPRDVWYVHKAMVPSRENWPVVWVYSTLLRIHQEKRRQEHILRATQELERLKAKLEGPRPRRRSERQIEEQIARIVSRLHVRDYVRAWVFEKQVERFRQEKPGRPGAQTRYLRTVRTRPSIAWEIDLRTIEYDKKSDGMYPLLTNDRSLSLRQVLEAHKRQSGLERRFRQAKSVHEIAPVFLHNEGRIVALFLLYFVALLVQALIEREIRAAMKKTGIKQLPLYPEERLCKQPTAHGIFRLFTFIDREKVFENSKLIGEFEPELTDLQKQVLGLLGVPMSAYLAR